MLFPGNSEQRVIIDNDEWGPPDSKPAFAKCCSPNKPLIL
jgi:hypothetical protein